MSNELDTKRKAEKVWNFGKMYAMDPADTTEPPVPLHSEAILITASEYEEAVRAGGLLNDRFDRLLVGQHLSQWIMVLKLDEDTLVKVTYKRMASGTVVGEDPASDEPYFYGTPITYEDALIEREQHI